jgi:hypothetical protein
MAFSPSQLGVAATTWRGRAADEVERQRHRRGLRYWTLLTRGAGSGVSRPLDGSLPLADLAAPDDEVISGDRGRRVVRIDGIRLGLAGGLILKQDTYKLRPMLRTPISRPRVAREFDGLEQLGRYGIPTVRALACSWAGTWPFFRRSYLLTREFEHALSLREWTRRCGAASESDADLDRQEIVALLSELLPALAALHADGFWISTLFGKNILIRRGERAPELAVCDVSRLRRRGRALHRPGAVRDLASLDKWADGVLDASTRRRLLGLYLDALDRPGEAREWAADIARRLSRMRHQTPSGRLSRRCRRSFEKVGLGDWWPL